MGLSIFAPNRLTGPTASGTHGVATGLRPLDAGVNRPRGGRRSGGHPPAGTSGHARPGCYRARSGGNKRTFLAGRETDRRERSAVRPGQTCRPWAAWQNRRGPTAGTPSDRSDRAHTAAPPLHPTGPRMMYGTRPDRSDRPPPTRTHDMHARASGGPARCRPSPVCLVLSGEATTQERSLPARGPCGGRRAGFLCNGGAGFARPGFDGAAPFSQILAAAGVPWIVEYSY